MAQPNTSDARQIAERLLCLAESAKAGRPDKLWVADIPYFPTWAGFLYLAVVLDAYDNAMAESFFATLECELIDRRRFKTQAEARMALFEFIEGWYNPHRRHSALGYLSPINHERTIRVQDAA
jgi:transposase InsO family protein